MSSSEKNRIHQPFWLVLISTGILLAATFFYPKIIIGKYISKETDLFSDVRETPRPPMVVVVKKDSLKIDSTKVALQPVSSDSSDIVSYGDSLNILPRFYQALKQKKKIRVAYFGDSMIEGDLITQDLRTLLQNRFGGHGVGYMPVTSVVAGFRTSIIHSYSDDWKDYTLLESMNIDHPIGLSGHVYVPGSYLYLTDTTSTSTELSWVRYTGVKKDHLNKFYHVKMYHGPSGKDNYIRFNDKLLAIKGTNSVNELILNEGKPISTMNVFFKNMSPVNVYGFSMETDSGILVDNYSFRGNSGMPLTKIPFAILSSFNRYFDYDLIILHYGVNVISPDVKDYSWYEAGMNNVIKHFKNACPNADILLVSTGDKSLREDGKYHTDPAVPIVVDTQRKIAKQNQIAFWSLYHGMGGYNSMLHWVEGDTVYAHRDYTHFNPKGAERVGKMFYEKLMKPYGKPSKKDIAVY